MSSQLVRLASFSTWPSTAAVSSLALARSGFKYTGHGESTVCTVCQLVVDNWQQGDRPDEVHSERSPNCAFVQEQMQPLISDSSIPRSSAAPAAATFMDRDHLNFKHLKDEAARLSTFYNWPERAARIVDPCDLARAGFFYSGETDRVQCAFCRGYLLNWVQGDVPADEHRRLFPYCPFVRQQYNDFGRLSGPSEYVCHFFKIIYLNSYLCRMSRAFSGSVPMHVPVYV